MRFPSPRAWLCAAAAALLAACGPTDAPDAQRGALPTRSQPDPDTPAGQYLEISNGLHLMLHYHALSRDNVPWDTLAAAADPAFLATENRFERQELLRSLRPQLEAQLARHGENRYIVIPMQVQLAAYDFQRGGFPVHGFAADSYLRFGPQDYALSFINGADFSLVPIAGEHLAREIENLRATRPSERYRARVHAYAQHTIEQAGQYTVRAQLLKVSIERPDGSVWFTY